MQVLTPRPSHLWAPPPHCTGQVYVTDSNIVVDAPELVKGRRVVLIEDGPTLTHGGMVYGAGKVWAGEGGRCRRRAALPGGGGTSNWRAMLFPDLPTLAPNTARHPPAAPPVCCREVRRR